MCWPFSSFFHYDPAVRPRAIRPSHHQQARCCLSFSYDLYLRPFLMYCTSDASTTCILYAAPLHRDVLAPVWCLWTFVKSLELVHLDHLIASYIIIRDLKGLRALRRYTACCSTKLVCSKCGCMRTLSAWWDEGSLDGKVYPFQQAWFFATRITLSPQLFSDLLSLSAKKIPGQIQTVDSWSLDIKFKYPGGPAHGAFKRTDRVDLRLSTGGRISTELPSLQKASSDLRRWINERAMHYTKVPRWWYLKLQLYTIYFIIFHISTLLGYTFVWIRTQRLIKAMGCI